MSRSRRFVGGIVFTYGYQVILVIAGIWLTPFLLERIGQRDFGLWLVGTQLLTYLTLTDFGVVALLPLETASSTGRAGGDARQATDLPEIVGRTIRMVLYQVPIVTGIALIAWLNLPPAWRDLQGPLGIVLVGFVLSFPLRILPAVLQGLQDLAFTGRMQVINWMLSTSATVAMVFAGWSLYALAIGWLISQIALGPLYFYRLWKKFPGIWPRRLPALPWSSTRPQLEKGFWISISQVAQLLVANTDLLIIGKLLGAEAVVPFACTGKLAGVLANQAYILMQEATPGLCEVKAGESRERVFRVLTSLSHGILAFSGLVFSIVVLVNHWFVNWWVPGQQYGGLLLTAVMLAQVLVRHWSMVNSYTVFCFGHQRRISLTNLADGLVTAGASYGLIQVFGLPGVPMGSIVGACLVSLPFNLHIIARETGVTVWRLIEGSLEGWAWRFALLAGSFLWLAARWSPTNIWEAGATSAAVAAIYLLVMLPNIMRSPMGDYIRPLLASARLKFTAFQVRFSS